MTTRELAKVSESAWQIALDNHQATVNYMKTFQGKHTTDENLSSVNGCTVIGALIVKKHLQKKGRDSSLTPEEVAHIIDHESPPVLHAIRSKLNLGDGAFLEPSDVTDHFSSDPILRGPDHRGGNILDAGELQSFVDLLESHGLNPPKKSAALFFFHAHVVGITRSLDGDTYDLFESLSPNVEVENGLVYTCRGKEALMACLRWRAGRAMSEEDHAFAEKREWDRDNFAASQENPDPRLFEGYIWAAV